MRLLQRERSLRRLFGKNHSSEIRLLQKLDQPPRYRCVMSNNVEKNAATVAGQHNVSRFGFTVEFRRRGEACLIQYFSQIDGPSDRGKTMIRHDKNVCRFACFVFVESRENGGEIFIGRLDPS